ncbi:hypothetical protein BDV95DRAFT_633624 [Massariosphaeria phaeospora]|uniref:Uncharacterized protein n=1 Tax=Massariosphaeria phaeospora TaxID=100035 RepID=A0A7C8MVK1_9PLEO|nr:hypothetical protein BDV95DRAFT_633624 [Massariosphaeria phaeospora]
MHALIPRNSFYPMQVLNERADAWHSSIHWPFKPESKVFRILDLCPELIASIASHLPDDDFLAFRLACRALKRHSMSEFGTRFFRVLGVWMHPRSLDVLEEIARHKKLAKFCGRQSIYQDLEYLALEFEKSSRNNRSWESNHASNHAQYQWQEAGWCNVLEEQVFHRARGTCNGIYRRALNALRHADRHGQVKLVLQFSQSESELAPQTRFFSLDQPKWMNPMTANLRTVRIQGGSPWLRQLVCSPSNLEALSIWRTPGSQAFDFEHGIARTFHWPHLTSLSLRKFEFRRGDLVGFLEAYKEQMSELNLCCIAFQDGGSWKAPLQMARSMPRLNRLRLHHMYDSAVVNENFDDFRNAVRNDRRNVDLEGRATITLVLDIVIRDYQTMWIREAEAEIVDFAQARVAAGLDSIWDRIVSFAFLFWALFKSRILGP